MAARKRVFSMIDTGPSREYTFECLKSFERTVNLSRGDSLFVLDNDNTLEESLRIGEKKVNAQPLGFAGNVNQMIRHAVSEGADLYFLNNDLILFPGWIEPLSPSDPVIRSPLSNREVQFAATTVVPRSEAVIKVFVTGNPMSLEDYRNNRGALEFMAESNSQNSRGELPVMCLPYFCVKLPLEVMKGVGLLDETYGLGGGEDYDYSLRASLAGFGTSFALASWIVHFGGKSSWSGVEDEDTRLKRERRFFEAFEEKWGRDLHDLILKEDSTVLDRSGLEPRGVKAFPDIRRNILSLLKERQPTVFLWY